MSRRESFNIEVTSSYIYKYFFFENNQNVEKIKNDLKFDWQVKAIIQAQ